MSTTIQTIQSIGDDRRRDSTSGSIDSTKKLRAVVDTLQQIHSYANWNFTTRNKVINYFAAESDYNVPDVLSITDFKDVKDLRVEDDHTNRFLKVAPGEFDTRNGSGDTGNFFAVEYRLGDPMLRINYAGGATPTQVGNTSDHDADGTWTPDTSTSDATNVTTDTNEYRVDGGSVNFDIDVSQSVNNQADISVTTAATTDLSNFLDFGAIFGYWFIPAIDTITGATLRWGSSSSDYYSASTTTNTQNGSLEAGWNRVKFDMVGASSTGSPDIAAIDYLLFRTSYAAGQVDDTDYRINGFKFYIPSRLELLYYSSFTAANSSGTWISEPTATTDTILIPDRYREVVVQGYLVNLFGQMGKLDEMAIAQKRFDRMLAMMAREFGVFPRSESQAMKPVVRWPS